MADKKRILYYCQSLVGIGHLTCSLRIIRELLAHSEVDLIQGGLGDGASLEREGFRNLRLPTLLHDHDTGGFVDPDEDRNTDIVWSERQKEISNFLRWPYHAIVIEFYPFGRRRFKSEIQDLFKSVRERCGPIPIFTSVREVLVPRVIEKERRMAESVKKYIHTVFVRGDPNIARFDETFSLTHEIQDRLCYTGYISPPPPTSRPARKKQILVSQGGGNVGRELLEGAISTAALMPEFSFLLATGSRTSEAEMAQLRGTILSNNVEIVPFLSDFQQRLMESAVSISMGGDNTLLDVLSARTPALAYPYQGNSEQGFRIKKFAEAGLLHALDGADLTGAKLKEKIELALNTPYPTREFAMNGAQVTSERIKAVLTQTA